MLFMKNLQGFSIIRSSLASYSLTIWIGRIEFHFYSSVKLVLKWEGVPLLSEQGAFFGASLSPLNWDSLSYETRSSLFYGESAFDLENWTWLSEVMTDVLASSFSIGLVNICRLSLAPSSRSV